MAGLKRNIVRKALDVRMARDRRANQGISPGFNIANSALTTDWLLFVPGTNLPTGYHINMPRHKNIMSRHNVCLFCGKQQVRSYKGIIRTLELCGYLSFCFETDASVSSDSLAPLKDYSISFSKSHCRFPSHRKFTWTGVI